MRISIPGYGSQEVDDTAAVVAAPITVAVGVVPTELLATPEQKPLVDNAPGEPAQQAATLEVPVTPGA